MIVIVLLLYGEASLLYIITILVLDDDSNCCVFLVASINEAKPLALPSLAVPAKSKGSWNSVLIFSPSK
jgi:hypothetical protein